MDNELIEVVARSVHDTLENDDDSGGGGYKRAARAALPLFRKHYAEVFAKVAEGYDCECDQSPDCMCWWTGVPAAIRQAGEAQ